MGTIDALQTAGLDVEFDQCLNDYFSDEGSKQELRQLIDNRGFKDPVVMKKISAMQRDKRGLLKQGIFKPLSKLNEALISIQQDGGNGSGGNGHSEEIEEPETSEETMEASEDTYEASGDPEEAEMLSDGVETSPDSEGTKKRRGNTLEPELSDEQLAAYQFSAEQEELIRKRLEAEEEKIRNRLLAQERKIRERIILGRAQRQTRLGLKAEDAAKLREARDTIRAAQDKIRELREEIRTAREVVGQFTQKRTVKPATHEEKQLRVAKRKYTMAVNSGDQEAMLIAKQNVANWEEIVAKQKAESSVTA